jgi:hypothetical protein
VVTANPEETQTMNRHSAFIARIATPALAVFALLLAGPAPLSAQEERIETPQQSTSAFLAAHPDIAADLKGNPKLVSEPAYLSRHPELRAFLRSHPEVSQASTAAAFPQIYTGFNYDDPLGREVQAGQCGPALKIQALQYELDKTRDEQYGRASGFNRIMDDMYPFLAFVIILGALLWVFRVILENRRWGKVAKVQSEVHSKLMEKFTNSQELLGYMQSEAGKKFLESTPFELEPQGGRATPFPFSRILWSVQLGLILGLAGLGLLYLRGSLVSADGSQTCLVLGTLAGTIGVGFLFSGAASYVLSRHLGLLEGVTSKNQ